MFGFSRKPPPAQEDLPEGVTKYDGLQPEYLYKGFGIVPCDGGGFAILTDLVEPGYVFKDLPDAMHQVDLIWAHKEGKPVVRRGKP